MERGKKTNKDRLFEQVEKRARGEAQGVDASHLAQNTEKSCKQSAQ